eukprot:scpid88188/ scgid14351/ Phosphoethanolamine N-methyltransferase
MENASAARSEAAAKADGSEEATRGEMKAFWEDHCTTASLEDVMLDSQAAVLNEAEKPEIRSMLPDLKGLRVLELGAGIGRYSGFLAEDAAHVTSVDFIQKFVDKNREVNGEKYTNIDFVCGDVMKLDWEENTYDIIFSNWLLMYLNDAEVLGLAEKMLRWTKPSGHIFFRESCNRPSGDRKRNTGNPTKYRDAKHYHHVFETVQYKQNDTTAYCLDLNFSRCIRSYLQLKNNPHQMCWSWQKATTIPVAETADCFGYQSMREFLDQQQYSENGILRYEKMFGKNYVSTGGPETTAEFVPMLKLQKDEKVLDVGSGLGGGALYMAENHGVDVLGL